MNNYITAVKAYIAAHKKDITTAAPIILFLAVLVGIVLFATFRNMPNIVYQPTKACDLLTPTIAQDLLGDKVNGVDKNDPKIANDLAVSKCSYSDLNDQAGKMKVVAVAVRSGINDKGVALNNAAFKASQKGKNYEEVKNLGENAYFNRELGQLNILDDKRWIILSYGYGDSPMDNNLEDSVDLARRILRD